MSCTEANDLWKVIVVWMHHRPRLDRQHYRQPETTTAFAVILQSEKVPVLCILNWA